MDETQVAIVAAIAAVAASAIGAGGAILAQFLTVRATDKASAKRFAWEQQQAIRREKAERDAVFAEAKRELFAKYLAIHSEYRQELTKASYHDHSGRLREMTAAFHKYNSDVFRVHGEIALIAPVLAEESWTLLTLGGDLYGTVSDAVDEHSSLASMVKIFEDSHYFESIESCRKSMATHLQGEGIPDQ